MFEEEASVGEGMISTGCGAMASACNQCLRWATALDLTLALTVLVSKAVKTVAIPGCNKSRTAADSWMTASSLHTVLGTVHFD